jgi:hypothetical protein
MTAADDLTLRVLDELGRVIRALSRISGGPDEGPAMTSTQRLALFELVEGGPMRLNDLARLRPRRAVPSTRSTRRGSSSAERIRPIVVPCGSS